MFTRPSPTTSTEEQLPSSWSTPSTTAKVSTACSSGWNNFTRRGAPPLLFFSLAPNVTLNVKLRLKTQWNLWRPSREPSSSRLPQKRATKLTNCSIKQLKQCTNSTRSRKTTATWSSQKEQRTYLWTRGSRAASPWRHRRLRKCERKRNVAERFQRILLHAQLIWMDESRDAILSL